MVQCIQYSMRSATKYFMYFHIVFYICTHILSESMQTCIILLQYWLCIYVSWFILYIKCTSIIHIHEIMALSFPLPPPTKKRTEIGWSIAGCIIPRRLLIHNNDWWMQLYIMRGYYFSSDHMNVFFCRYILTMYIEACVFQLIRI